MRYGHLLTRLLFDALQREESELLALTGNWPRPETVLYHNECVLQHLVFRRSLVEPGCPRVGREYNDIDVTFLDGDTHLAEFEFKRPFTASKRDDTFLCRVVNDFSKQLGRRRAKREIEHYVVLPPCGQPEEIREWIDSYLLAEVRRGVRDIDLAPPIYSDFLPLNHKGKFLRVVTFEVGVAEARAESA